MPKAKTEDKSAKETVADQNADLDEELEDTFPASDPPASTAPGHSRPDPNDKAKPAEKK